MLFEVFKMHQMQLCHHDSPCDIPVATVYRYLRFNIFPAHL